MSKITVLISCLLSLNVYAKINVEKAAVLTLKDGQLTVQTLNQTYQEEIDFRKIKFQSTCERYQTVCVQWGQRSDCSWDEMGGPICRTVPYCMQTARQLVKVKKNIRLYLSRDVYYSVDPFTFQFSCGLASDDRVKFWTSSDEVVVKRPWLTSHTFWVDFKRSK